MIAGISKRDWGICDKQPVYLFRLVNSSGAYVELTNYGATVVSVVVIDKFDQLGNVVLGFAELAGYLADRCYIGATIGRYANRIACASFMLGGIRHQLQANDGAHANHGGGSGFHNRVFSAKVEKNSVCFVLHSPDNYGGFPGNLKLSVTYSWTDSCELIISYEAFSDRQTVLNITNHAYFNLAGEPGPFKGHQLELNACGLVELGQGYIPTGKILPFQRTVIENFEGLNHCYVLPKVNTHDRGTRQAATLRHHSSGREMEVHTSYPGLLVYSADFLWSKAVGHGGYPYAPLEGICLECQYFPDSPNHPTFPSTTLLDGQSYNEHIIYKFNVSKN